LVELIRKFVNIFVGKEMGKRLSRGFWSKFRSAVLAGVVLCIFIAIALFLGQLVKAPEGDKKPVPAGIQSESKNNDPELKKQQPPKDKDTEQQKPTTVQKRKDAPQEPNKEKQQKERQHVKQLQDDLREIKKAFEQKMTLLEKELIEQKKVNTHLKERIERARKSDQKPDVKETTPTSDMVKEIHKQTLVAEQKHQEVRQQRVQKETTWVEDFQKIFKERKEQPSGKPTDTKDPLTELRKSFSDDEKALKEAVHTSKQAEDRLSPGRGSVSAHSSVKKLNKVQPAQERYDQAFRGFISVGNEKAKKSSIQWAILNDRGKGLREVYHLFNMTPMIRLNNSYYDLSTGESVTRYKIDAFAPVGILSEDPWQDFGDLLKAAEQKSGADFKHAEIIYFMSDRMLNYFRIKVGRAVGCFFDQSNLKTYQPKEEEIRVVGRVLAVTAPDGQHRFGIYIPTRVEVFNKETGEIEEVNIETTQCFGKDPDVGPLLADGII